MKTSTPIDCEFLACGQPAERGGIVVVQPNGLAPSHATYYACSDHPDILAKALETWPVGSDQDVEQLGSEVWDALEAAGHQPAPEGAGCDGFDVLKPREGRMDHVAVVARFEGVMSGMGTPGVRRGTFYRLENTLTAAGFHVSRFETGENVPMALAVARDPGVAEGALEQMRISAASEQGAGR